jgi:hypothetical protein
MCASWTRLDAQGPDWWSSALLADETPVERPVSGS